MTGAHPNLRNVMMVRYVYTYVIYAYKLDVCRLLFFSMSRGNDREESETNTERERKKIRKKEKKKEQRVSVYLQVKCHEYE